MYSQEMLKTTNILTDTVLKFLVYHHFVFKALHSSRIKFLVKHIIKTSASLKL